MSIVDVLTTCSRAPVAGARPVLLAGSPAATDGVPCSCSSLPRRPAIRRGDRSRTQWDGCERRALGEGEGAIDEQRRRAKVGATGIARMFPSSDNALRVAPTAGHLRSARRGRRSNWWGGDVPATRGLSRWTPPGPGERAGLVRLVLLPALRRHLIG